MTALTDEILMAYVDGELDETQALEVQRAVESDADARRRMEVFIQSTDMLQGVYDAPLHEPVPDRLMDSIRNPKKQPAPQGLFAMIRSLACMFQFPHHWKSVHILAAFMALFVGAGIVHLTHIMTGPDQHIQGLALNGGIFSQGMETTISGQPFDLKDQGLVIIPVATFRDSSNQYCRQYEVTQKQGGSTPVLLGFACRSSTGSWSTIVSVYPTPDPQPGSSEQHYVTAGADNLMDNIYTGLTVSPPISLQQESELIKQAWPAAPAAE